MEDYDMISVSGASTESIEVVDLCQALTEISHAKGNSKQRELMIAALESAVTSYRLYKQVSINAYEAHLRKSLIKVVKK